MKLKFALSDLFMLLYASKACNWSGLHLFLAIRSTEQFGSKILTNICCKTNNTYITHYIHLWTWEWQCENSYTIRGSLQTRPYHALLLFLHKILNTFPWRATTSALSSQRLPQLPVPVPCTQSNMQQNLNSHKNGGTEKDEVVELTGSLGTKKKSPFYN